MTFAIRPSDRVQPEIRRIGAECLDRAIGKLEGLDDRSPEDIEEAIHDVRKRCKEVRALARLVRQPIGSRWRPFNTLVREASNELSSIRDAHAIAATLDDLRAVTRGEDDSDLKLVQAAQARIAVTATQHIQAGDVRIERARQLLTAARLSVDHWKIGAGSNWLAVGMAATYGKGRRDLRRARDHPTDARLHEWRKRVKTLWYQTRLVEAAAPSVLSPLVARLDDLAEALGDDHDLSVLVTRLHTHPGRYGGKKSVKRAVKRVRSQQTDLRQRAFRLGASLYAEPSAAFVARIGRYWRITLRTGIEIPTGGITEILADEQGSQETTDSEQQHEPPSCSVELERKFLVTDLPEPAAPGNRLRQGYLATDGSVSVRIRDSEQDGCTLTIKAGRGSVRTELEWPISRHQFEGLWPLTADRRIDKVRYLVPIDGGRGSNTGLVVEVDVFRGDLEGLLVAEVEFESVDSMDRFSPLDWFGTEVTNDASYTNASLSTRSARPGPAVNQRR